MTKQRLQYAWCSFLTLTVLNYACSENDSQKASDAGHKNDAIQEHDAAKTAQERFSFFVTSFAALKRLSGSESGFGGDLRYGEKDGLSGADKICTEIAESSLPGSGAKGWRAFLSVTRGPNGAPLHARDRIGNGPWYDRLGRLLAQDLSDLLSEVRPLGGDSAIVDDFPNEDGVPNRAPDGERVDNHDTLTGSGEDGRIYKADDWGCTCHDWTSAEGGDGQPRVGHSWGRRLGGTDGFDPSMFFRDGGPDVEALCGDGGFLADLCVDGGLPPFLAELDGGLPSFTPVPGVDPGDFMHWISAHNEPGCAPGASLIETGPPTPNNPTVGAGGGYGGIYCFALKP